MAAALWTSAILALAACSTSRDGGTALPRDAILLWHNLPEPEAAALNNAIGRYRSANPGVEIVVQEQGAELDQEFMRATRSGLSHRCHER